MSYKTSIDQSDHASPIKSSGQRGQPKQGAMGVTNRNPVSESSSDNKPPSDSSSHSGKVDNSDASDDYNSSDSDKMEDGEDKDPNHQETKNSMAPEEKRQMVLDNVRRFEEARGGKNFEDIDPEEAGKN